MCPQAPILGKGNQSPPAFVPMNDNLSGYLPHFNDVQKFSQLKSILCINGRHRFVINLSQHCCFWRRDYPPSEKFFRLATLAIIIPPFSNPSRRPCMCNRWRIGYEKLTSEHNRKCYFDTSQTTLKIIECAYYLGLIIILLSKILLSKTQIFADPQSPK